MHSWLGYLAALLVALSVDCSMAVGQLDFRDTHRKQLFLRGPVKSMSRHIPIYVMDTRLRPITNVTGFFLLPAIPRSIRLIP